MSHRFNSCTRSWRRNRIQ